MQTGIAAKIAITAVLLALVVPNLTAQQPQSSFTPATEERLATFFKQYSMPQTLDESISEKTRERGGHAPQSLVIERDAVEKFQDHGSRLARSTGISPLVLAAVANSSLIIRGTPVDSRSLPFLDRTFLFTEYRVRVDRIYFDSTKSLSPGDVIVVSREGGSIEMGSTRVEAIDSSYDQFTLNNPYAFALIPVANTGTYRATAPHTFTVSDGAVISSSKLESSYFEKESLSVFEQRVQTAVRYKQTVRKARPVTTFQHKKSAADAALFINRN
jgi:hypothetical protein